MDQQNDEFEVFLRQFHLRSPGPLPEAVSLRSRLQSRWLLGAAAVACAVLVAAAVVGNFARAGRAYATVQAAGDSRYKNGEKINAGHRVQSGPSESMVMALEDGTRVEMRSESELLLESAGDSVRIRLNGGSVIVNAERRPAGRLYVETRDVVASVVGTVFLVRVEQAGTRVAVIDGEVQVQQGPASKTLASGETMATDPSLESLSIAGEIAWSRSAGTHVALLQQSAPILPPPSDNARQAPAPRQVQPIRTRPIDVSPIGVAPVAVSPMPPVIASQGQGGRDEADTGVRQEQQSAVPPRQQQNPLPEGPGRHILDRSCSACHRAESVWTRRFSTEGEIVELINREIGRGANISQPEFSVLVDYLSANLRRKKK